MKRLAMVLMLGMAGCTETKPQETKDSSNPDIKVELLFEHEGCRVYRFHDNDEPVYYANCEGSTNWTTSHQGADGKTIIEDPHQSITHK